MPIHEYRCQDCRRKVAVFYRRLSDVDHSSARCDRCGSARLSRLVSRVRMVRGASAELGPAGDVDESMLEDAAGLDENDPRSLGRFMRRMADEAGEDVGPEFDEIIGRLERGDDPERIEQEMGDMLGEAAESEGAGEPAVEAAPPPPKKARTRTKARAKAKAK